MDPASEGDSSDDTELSTTLPGWARPALPRPSLGFACGEVINERFEVLEMIGAGGMGQVYRVRDRRSGNTRALKTLKEDLLIDPEGRRRFERELVDAQQITHPNVCRVYDIDSVRDRSQDQPFYTMELLAGETLRQRLQREHPIRPKEALQIVRGIAAGLDAAHTTGGGIVHRDLKPANIMLVKGPEGIRPVILDFGIAKRLEGADETSTLGRPGTPAYMAPEQKTGNAVSAATDVYALALILTEMLSQTGAARYHRVLDRALAADSTKRYQSAGALAGALERVDRTRRWWLISAGLAVPAAAGSLARWHALGPTGVPLVVVAPVASSLKATGGSRAVEPKAVQRLIEHQIGQSRAVEIVSRERLAVRVKELSGGEARAELDSSMLRRAAAAEGAPYLLFSELGQLGGRLQLRLTLEKDGRAIENETFPFAEPGDLPAVSAEAADWVRAKLQRPGVRTRDPGLPELTTANWDALQAYVRGDEAWQERREADAARQFEEALRIDPQFAGAEARLGDILMASGRVDEALAHWGTAAGLARTRALATREMLRIRGVFALDTGDSLEAERALALFVATYPNDALARFYYAAAAIRLNRPDQALEMMEQATRLAPNSYPFRMGVATVRLFRGEMEAAKKVLRDAQALQPNDGAARHALAAIAFAENRFEDCRSLLESILGQSDDGSRSNALSALACLEAELGRREAVVRWIDMGLELDRRLNAVSALRRKLRLKAEYFLSVDDRSSAVSVCGQILGLGVGAQAEMEAGCMLARAGAVARAEACRVRKLVNWPIYLHWQKRLEGEISLARGDARGALRVMLEAPPRPDNAYWPEFAFRAAMAAGERSQARALAQSMLGRLAYRWMEADRTALGFIRLARSVS
jgi:tetratricopeptide (TPR) repeat protein